MFVRKLSQDLEQSVAIAYFCGVPMNKLVSQFGVSNRTIDTSIVKHYSPRWNHSLVEYYRREVKTQNAVHFYLSTKGDILPFSENITAEFSSTSDFILNNTIFPEVQKIIRETGIETLFNEHQSGYEILINDFTGRSPRRITEGYVLPLLRSSYPNVCWETIRRSAISSIAEKLKSGGIGISPLKIEFIEEMVSTLSNKEQQVIRKKYLSSTQTLGNVGVGKALGSTRENIRQYLFRIHNRFATGPLKDSLSFIAGLVTDNDIKKYRSQQKRQRWKSVVYFPVTDEVSKDLQQHPTSYYVKYSIIKDVIIEQTNLSNRIKKCLASDSIRTVEHLLQKSEEDLFPIKSFGKTCLTEIRLFLERLQLHLRGEEKDPYFLLRIGDLE